MQSFVAQVVQCENNFVSDTTDTIHMPHIHVLTCVTVTETPCVFTI